MQQLDLIVEQYLQLDTDYALLTTGDWGTGKTYYFNNVVKPIIEKTTSIRDNKKRYKTISISLFGVKSIGEIQTQILLSSYEPLKGKKFKTAGAFLSTLAKGFLNVTGFNAETIDPSLWAEIINEIKGFDDLVICFDDIERKSPDLHISQFIGFVNSLIEKYNSKIILIANEDKITDFEESKEKVIGNTVEYLPDYEVIFDSIIKSKYKENENYHAFLYTQKNTILDVFNNTSKNLRTLKYALEQYEKIYNELGKLTENESAFRSKKNEILKTTLYFTYVISEEYRIGNISFTNKKNIDSLNMYSMLLAKETYNDSQGIVNNEEVSQEKYLKEFSKKYYPSFFYNYFDSIYGLITGGDVFRIEKLKLEIIKIYHINELGITLPQYETLEKVSWLNVYKLENKEYKYLTKKVINYAFNGAYSQLNEYASIFYYALRFNNPFGYSPDMLVQNLKKGIRRIKNLEADLSIKYQYNDYTNISDNDIYKEQKRDLYQFILNLNNDLEIKSKGKETKELEKLCTSDLLKFCETIKDNYTLNLLCDFNSRIFYSAFINSNNETKYYSYNIIETCFKRMAYDLPNIYKFLTELKKYLEKGKKQHIKKSLGGYYFNALCVLIDNAILEVKEKQIEE